MLPEELFCCLVGGIQSCSIASGSAPTAVLIGQLVPNPLGKTLYSLLKTQVIDLLQKAVSISALATPKAVIKPCLRANVKTRASLIMEGAEPLHRADPGGLEGHIITHDIGDVDALAYLIDVSALNQPRHIASLVRQRL